MAVEGQPPDMPSAAVSSAAPCSMATESAKTGADGGMTVLMAIAWLVPHIRKPQASSRPATRMATAGRGR